ncbi:STAS domain-containing protein [Polymorphospora rubra]|uniref:STAS domain-containing protein n=1 Tax=Polymorphospora rubra TaxID=338584 RepID=UPI001BB3BBFF|nr:STAS domain-containing protein [Polymorphospora rubra]
MIRVQALSTSRLDVTVDAAGDALEVRVAGEIDIANVDEFRVLLWSLPAGAVTARVDLSGLEFLSAAGIRALIAAHLRLRARGTQLVLCRPTPLVRRILRISRVNRVIPVIGTALPATDQPAVGRRTAEQRGADRPAPRRPGPDRSGPEKATSDKAGQRAWQSSARDALPVRCGRAA